MAFNSESLDQTQRVNISKSAMLVLENDKLAFLGTRERWSSFLNSIITNFKDDAQASISIAVTKESQQIENCFHHLNKEEQSCAVEYCIRYFRNKILSTQRYTKGESIKFRINDENFRYLTDPDSECKEDVYYQDGSKTPRISLYLKALFEEYAEKPLHQRELIFFSDKYRTIKTAIDDNIQLKIQVLSGKTYYVKPYKIELATYHYLIGKSLPAENSGDVCSKNSTFRLSNMASLHLIKSRSGRLSEHEKRELRESIYEKGAQFLTDAVTEIKIKLTERGIQKYQSQLHLRPAYKEILPNNVYCFNCTEVQAEYYFFKFGADALILEPKTLAQRFCEMYQNAASIYFKDIL